MKDKGLPFILGITESETPDEVARGVRVSVIAEAHKGDYNGLLAAGVVTAVGGNLNGVSVGGIVNLVDGNLNGVSTGLVNLVDGDLDGVSVGLINHAKGNGELTFQFGLYNNISEYSSEGGVVQIGLYNKIGEQTFPLLNIRRFFDGYRRRK